nr:hypothetical protein Iba_chr14bCG11820 [Ipomoea batatas]
MGFDEAAKDCSGGGGRLTTYNNGVLPTWAAFWRSRVAVFGGLRWQALANRVGYRTVSVIFLQLQSNDDFAAWLSKVVDGRNDDAIRACNVPTNSSEHAIDPGINDGVIIHVDAAVFSDRDEGMCLLWCMGVMGGIWRLATVQ